MAHGLKFEVELPSIRSAPTRTDIACFVGFVRRRSLSIPAWLRRWMEERGWYQDRYGRSQVDHEALLDLPVPIDTWDTFDNLFAWSERTASGPDRNVHSYLGSAVRSFFAQGGRKCYVVRVGDPWPLQHPRAERLPLLQKVIPGHPIRVDCTAAERRTWRGIGHLFGLPDVSFLCLPDLADGVGADRPPYEPPVLSSAPEQFVLCSDEIASPPPDSLLLSLPAPRCDESGYEEWRNTLRVVSEFLSRNAREVQLVAAVPMPLSGATATSLSMESVLSGCLDRSLDGGGLATAFLQLAYPWIRSSASTRMPEALEAPDAALIGILARNALLRGTFRSAANLPLSGAYDLHPSIHPDRFLGQERDSTLHERVSLFHRTASGFRLLSDVTTHRHSYRPASVNRLVAAIVRTARLTGEDLTFEPSDERVWQRLRRQLEELLEALWRAGALRGVTRTEAFQVRCDRTTMTQNDIDNGRLIARIEFDAAMPIESITVVFAMDEGGRASLVFSEEAEAA